MFAFFFFSYHLKTQNFTTSFTTHFSVQNFNKFANQFSQLLLTDVYTLEFGKKKKKQKNAYTYISIITFKILKFHVK